jgi:hypothetical protein
MRPVPGAILAFIIASIVTYIVVVAGGHSLMQGVSDPGGNRAIQFMFQIGPLCAIVGGIVAAIVTGRRLARGGRPATAGEPPATKPQPPALRGAIMVLVAIGLAYALARILFGLP